MIKITYMENQNEWKEFEPSFKGMKFKHKPYYYWWWVRIKRIFGIKTKIEFEEIGTTKAKYKQEGKMIHVKILFTPDKK